MKMGGAYARCVALTGAHGVSGAGSSCVPAVCFGFSGSMEPICDEALQIASVEWGGCPEDAKEEREADGEEVCVCCIGGAEVFCGGDGCEERM